MPIQEYREYRCTDGHRWKVPGIFHWNPWGPSDFEVSNSNDIQCPNCGRVGEPVSVEDIRKRAGLLRTPPTGTTKAVSHMVQTMEGRPPEDHNRTLLYYREQSLEGK